MKIIQLMPTITYGDAVSNHALAIAKLLKSMGYETAIYAENIGERLPVGLVHSVVKLPHLDKKDIIIYHASTGTELNQRIPALPGRKLMIYHNITPPEFFYGFSPIEEKITAKGLRQMQYLRDQFDYCIADSEFNKENLREMGFACPIDVCPLLIEFSDYSKEPNTQIIQSYREDEYVNLLFVGRVAPNKKHENIIRAFYFYKNFINKKSRLFFVGHSGGGYLESLKEYIRALDLEDSVIFAGHVKFDEILAYYHVADAFVCMSEHEGFCVPLAEAMYFDVPIVAYNSTAIPYTLGGSGVLLDTNNPIPAAEAIHKVVSDEAYRNRILEGQRKRLQDFNQNLVAEKMKQLIQAFVDVGAPCE